MARRNSYQKGCLFKRGRNWVARWREKVIQADGSPGWIQRGEALGRIAELSERRAQRLLAAKLQPLNEGRSRPQSQITFGQFVTQEWEPAVRPLLKPSTFSLYRKLLRKHLLPAFEHEKLGDVSRAAIHRLLVQKLTQGLSPNHVHGIRTTLSKILSVAVQLEYLDRNPMRELKLGGRENVKERTVLSAAQINRLLSALPRPEQALVKFAVLTGFRPGEQFGLRWKNVNLLGKVIYVRETFSSGRFGSPKTKVSIRDVPMSERLVELLTAQRQGCGPVDGESLVFPDRDGSPMNWEKRLNQGVLHPICTGLGLPKISWHSFRHSQATLMGQTGEPQRTAQAILGHGSSKTTDQYIHSVPESERRAMDKVAEQLFPASENKKAGVGINPISMNRLRQTRRTADSVRKLSAG